MGVIDYGAGNLHSVVSALKRLDAEVVIITNPEDGGEVDKLVFPGVGSAGKAMEALVHSGLNELLIQTKKPVLAICLGMQLLFESSEEGNVRGLGIIPGEVRKLPTEERWPHVGWNELQNLKGNLFDGLPTGFVYFVHGYAVPVGAFTSSICQLEQPFSASVSFKNFEGCQFHPEKSGAYGAKILENFLKS